MVDTTIYSGRIGIGRVIDTFEYADYSDDLSAINALLTNTWAVTNGALIVFIYPQFLATLPAGINAGTRGKKVMGISSIATGETITRTLPTENALARQKSNERYLAIRCSMNPEATGTINLRPIIVNNQGPEEYAACDTPQAITTEMHTYLFKLGPTGGEFNTDLDQAGGTGGNHLDYGSWAGSDILKKIALGLEIASGSAEFWLDEIDIIDLDPETVASFHYDRVPINSSFDYDEIDVSGGHGTYTRPRQTLPAIIGINGIMLDTEADSWGWFLMLRARISALLSMLGDSNFGEWNLFLLLEELVMPVDVLEVGRGHNRISYNTAELTMSLRENTNQVVLD